MPTFTNMRGLGFDPDTADTLAKAYHAACEDLQDGGLVDLLKEIIAKRILEAASKGERDPDRLCSKALKGLGIDQHQS